MMGRGKLRQLGRLMRSFVAYQRRRTRNLPPPFRLWIEPTNVCNLSCVVCPTGLGMVKRKGSMSFETFASIIAQCREYAYDVNLHHRGESLLHPELGEMIRHARQNGVLTNLHTNAALLTEEKAGEILDSGLDLISFSFLGHDAHAHDRLSSEGEFERTVRNVVDFLRLKAERGGGGPFTIVQTLSIPTETSEDPARAPREFRRRFAGLGVDRFIVVPAHNFAGDVKLPGQQEPCTPARFSPCTFPWYSLTILWEGTVLPCPQDFLERRPLGNVNDASLLEIWDGERLRDLRAKMVQCEVGEIEPCCRCDRLCRRTLLGMPTAHLGGFLRENLLRRAR